MSMISGQAHWAKIVGKPHAGYKNGPDEWSFDVALDEATVAKLKDEGAGFYIRNKGDDRGDFISFKRKAIKQDGSPAQPVKIVDRNKQPWDTKFIGNGSQVNVKYALNETDNGQKPSVIAVQVVDLVEYEGKDGFQSYDSGDGTSTEESWA